MTDEPLDRAAIVECLRDIGSELDDYEPARHDDSFLAAANMLEADEKRIAELEFNVLAVSRLRMNE